MEEPGDGAPRETVSWNDDYLDDSGSEEDDLMTGVIADDPNKFEVLCDGVLNTTALLHESLRDFLDVKDTLLHHFLPPSVLLAMSTTSSKLFRSVTDMQEPIHELIRMVRIFSTPWEEKSAALKKLHEDFHKKKRQLDVAIRRLGIIDAMSKKIAYERKILNWEKLYCKVTSVQGHGRRWKYTIEELKERTKQGYDVLVHHVDQIEQDINEPYPEMELRTESVAPQMDPIAEEGEEGSHMDDESAAERFSEGSDSEESIGPETLQSGFSMQQVPMTLEAPKPEVSDFGQTTNPADYDVILHVRCYCPKGVEGKLIRCSITHGTQFEKTSRLDFTDEEIAQQVADAPPTKPKGPKRKGAPPPPPEPEIPVPVKFSELRFKLPVKMSGRHEIPPKLEPLTVSVHVGEDEEIIGMATIEVEDIEGCEMPEVFELPFSTDSTTELSLQDSIMYTANSVVDSELQLAEPLPVSFPIYPLGGGKAGAELQAAGSLPLFFYYKKIYKPKKLNRAIGTGTLRDLIKDEIGVDILEHSKESLFPDTHDMAASPMTIRDTPTPSRSRSADIDDAIPNEELEAILDSHQRDMENMQQGYEQKLMAMHAEIQRLNAVLQNQPRQDPPPTYEQPPDDGNAHRPFVFKRERREKKKIPKSQKLPIWGESLPIDFFDRLEMFQEESEANRRAIAEHVKREESENIEKKLAFQNKAFRGQQNDVVDALKDVTLPALYNPNTGNNVYNPRVHQYFHPTGTTGLRLTQPPSMMNLPPLKNKMSVINLFDIGQSIHNPNQLLQRYMNIRSERENTRMSDAPANTADRSKRQYPPDVEIPGAPMSAGERLESTQT